ncbi:MAG: polyprenol monophosphomannose synthase [Planctomycetes bacterium]|nr:polyprenol monophosphomannose synthase [Planctomycetota bacterium]
MRILVVIPTLDEAENIGPLLDRLLALPLDLGVVVVDDASADGTAAIVRARLADPRLLLIERPGRLGLGSAYAAGFAEARRLGVDFAATMDADFSHEPEALPALLNRAEREAADLVVGSRYVPGGSIDNWGPGRRLLSAVANRLTRGLVGIPVADCTSGYRLYRTAVFDRVDPDRIRSHGYSYLEEMIVACWRAGLVIREEPIRFVDRRAGRSKISQIEILKGAVTLLRLGLSRRR